MNHQAGLMRRATKFAGQKWRSVDWHKPGTRDGLAILGVVLAVYAAAHFFDLPPKLFQFGSDNAAWEVDDMIFVVFCLSVGLAIFSFRRVKELGVEMKARRHAELEAQQLARHDPLTGLPNRRFFVEKLREVLMTTTDTSRSAVVMLDLDGFKSINDSYGHSMGDRALAEFADRVSGVLRSGAILTRVGATSLR